MKVLLSAYACEPNKGSEPGVGWNWAIEIARLGHKVWVLTRANNQPSIDSKYLSLPEKNNLRFLYYDLPGWAAWWKRGNKGIHLYYLLWQIGACRLAKKIHREVVFNLVHHITFVSIRQPSFMGNLGIPFIFGPAAGGDRSPRQLRYSFGLKGWIIDFLRGLAKFTLKIDPFMWKTFYHADRIYVTSQKTMYLLPKRYRKKTKIQLAIGIERPKSLVVRGKKNPFRVLYVGRFIYWKGMQFGLHSFARLLESVPDSMLTMVGEGPEEKRLKSLSIKLSIAQKIEWLPWIEQVQLYRIYSQHDVFLFPSLHDSGGQVVLEAMAHGLPVVCLNLGGPGKIVNGICGYKIPVEGLKEEKIKELLANALLKLATDRSVRAKLSSGALSRVKDFTWASTIKDIYAKNHIESYNTYP